MPWDLLSNLVTTCELHQLNLQGSLARSFNRLLPFHGDKLEGLYDAAVARAILTADLLQVRVEIADVDPCIREVDWPNCKTGLERMRRVDERDFLDVVLCSDRVLAKTG